MCDFCSSYPRISGVYLFDYVEKHCVANSGIFLKPENCGRNNEVKWQFQVWWFSTAPTVMSSEVLFLTLPALKKLFANPSLNWKNQDDARTAFIPFPTDRRGKDIVKYFLWEKCTKDDRNSSRIVSEGRCLKYNDEYVYSDEEIATEGETLAGLRHGFSGSVLGATPIKSLKWGGIPYLEMIALHLEIRLQCTELETLSARINEEGLPNEQEEVCRGLSVLLEGSRVDRHRGRHFPPITKDQRCLQFGVDLLYTLGRGNVLRTSAL